MEQLHNILYDLSIKYSFDVTEASEFILDKYYKDDSSYLIRQIKLCDIIGLEHKYKNDYQQIRKQCNKKLLQLHPDLSNKDTHKEMREVRDAYLELVLYSVCKT